ncbi:hypothetical protein HY333_00590 [Candidatus Collierbacteria bacterium]|nr:hypothetical protein [Candidatus Collierbacteria bacterium]
MDLTSRQIAIVKAIVEEYTQTAEPVGSVTLENKFRLGVSPATLRNEMAALVDKGFLSQPHASAGRIPTPLAIKFYVNELMKERELSVAEEIAVKEPLWDHRFDLDSLLREATRVLSERTKSLSVAAIDQGKTYHAGYANLLSTEEFFDLTIARAVYELLDHSNRLMEVFQRGSGNQPVHFLIGDELGVQFYEPVGCLFADLHIGHQRGSLGIISSSRQTYPHIPIVKYVANLVNQIAQE